ncbi:MAG TPA: hypothetical protein VEC08_06015 [Nitrososphaerales archaeon]|nr:hypothetical protein [Nitrososphaerales archaeon]
MKFRTGVATATIVVVLVVIIAVAGAGTYVFVFSSPNSHGAKTTTTSTLKVGTSLTSGPTVTQTLGVGTTATGTQSNLTYEGTFMYTVPLGPSGINDSTGKPIQWNSTQTASGSFTFSINPATYLGSGRGHGSITVTTRGYCTGSSTVPYTFSISAVNLPETKNISISFDDPTPTNITVQLSCLGSTGGFYTANNPVKYLSVYPNGLDLDSFPANVSQVLSGGISYSYDITETS